MILGSMFVLVNVEFQFLNDDFYLSNTFPTDLNTCVTHFTNQAKSLIEILRKIERMGKHMNNTMNTKENMKCKSSTHQTPRKDIVCQ